VHEKACVVLEERVTSALTINDLVRTDRSATLPDAVHRRSMTAGLQRRREPLLDTPGGNGRDVRSWSRLRGNRRDGVPISGASDQRAYWRNLCSGIESITVLTDNELAGAGVPAERLSDPPMSSRTHPSDIDQFDAAFFEYSPTEAR
jgi:hypothetical protein